MFQDARLYQVGFLSLFLLLGIGTRDWTLRPAMVAGAIAACVLTQWLIMTLKAQIRFDTASDALSSPTALPPPLSPTALLSPLITGLGLSLLLRADHFSTMMLAGSAAILSKFLLRVGDKHLFNPANFGIVAAVLLMGDAWVSPGQWGEASWYALVFLGAGGIVLQKVGRWDTSIAFLGSYALMEAGRNLWLGWTWDVWLHRLSSGSFLLFALFMVTDPRSIPDARIARIIWAIAIALLTFILRNVYFIPTAVFWALFALAPLTPILDFLWKAPRFEWTVPTTELKTQSPPVP